MLAMLLVYGPHKSILPDAEELSKTENVLYGTFHRFLWGLVLAWVTYACHYGAGGLFLFFRFQYFLLCVPDYPINISPCRKPITREIIINLVLSVYENRIEQCFAAHIVQCCQQYCSTFLHLIQPRRYYSIFLTTLNNVDRISVLFLTTLSRSIIFSISSHQLLLTSRNALKQSLVDLIKAFYRAVIDGRDEDRTHRLISFHHNKCAASYQAGLMQVDFLFPNLMLVVSTTKLHQVCIYLASSTLIFTDFFKLDEAKILDTYLMTNFHQAGKISSCNLHQT